MQKTQEKFEMPHKLKQLHKICKFQQSRSLNSILNEDKLQKLVPETKSNNERGL